MYLFLLGLSMIQIGPLNDQIRTPDLLLLGLRSKKVSLLVLLPPPAILYFFMVKHFSQFSLQLTALRPPFLHLCSSTRAALVRILSNCTARRKVGL
mmetsp:Transcript_25313/g.42284  ORF Transcript_25313/g.42284 Transcript_25313/m.42284 type:complete len:96 (-) Transcript_25313:692-979(-)